MSSSATTDTGAVVEAYSGYHFAERPRAFIWQGRRYDVLSVERRWRAPGGLGFVVRAGSGAGDDRAVEQWELMYDEVHDTWRVRRVGVNDDGCG